MFCGYETPIPELHSWSYPYAATPSRGTAAACVTSCATFSSSDIRPTRSATRADHGSDMFLNGNHGTGGAGGDGGGDG